MSQWHIQELEYPSPSVMSKDLCPDCEKRLKDNSHSSTKVCIDGVVKAKLCTEIFQVKD